MVGDYGNFTSEINALGQYEKKPAYSNILVILIHQRQPKLEKLNNKKCFTNDVSSP